MVVTAEVVEGRDKPVIGKEFNQIINNDVLQKISTAALSLHNDLLYTNKDEAKEIVEEMVDASQKMVNCFIEQQKTTLMKLIDAV